MGTSLATTGAYLLAGELSKLEKGEHPAKALEAYESTFRPFVEESQKVPICFPAIAHPETAWKRWLFHVFIGAFSKVVAVPWVANRFGDDSNDENFPLPRYPSFDDEGSKEGTNALSGAGTIY